MNAHMGIGTILLLESLFYGRGTLVSHIERERTRHTDMHLDGYLVAYATSSQIVNLTHSLPHGSSLHDEGLFRL